MDKISEKFSIYASALDLNIASEELRNENSQDKEDDELRKSVLLSIVMSTEIRWKKRVELTQIIEYSEYRQKGFPDSLNDIVSTTDLKT